MTLRKGAEKLAKHVLNEEETLWLIIIFLILLVEVIGSIFPFVFEPVLGLIEDRSTLFLFFALFMVVRVVIIKTEELGLKIKPDIQKTNNSHENKNMAREMMNSSENDIFATYYNSTTPGKVEDEYDDFILEPLNKGVTCRRIIMISNEDGIDFANWLLEKQKANDNLCVRLLKTGGGLPSGRILTDFIVKDEKSVFMSSLRSKQGETSETHEPSPQGKGIRINERDVAEWHKNNLMELWTDEDITEDLTKENIQNIEDQLQN